ncbi:unnamed protein product [Rotaria sp. Silwood1]|nr:unnamed protein product [Rotaria sp. Silwood1]
MIDIQCVNTTLQPDSILVEPEAQLDIDYSIEQRVIETDSLSNETTTSQPFILAFLMADKGIDIKTMLPDDTDWAPVETL